MILRAIGSLAAVGLFFFVAWAVHQDVKETASLEAQLTLLREKDASIVESLNALRHDLDRLERKSGGDTRKPTPYKLNP